MVRTAQFIARRCQHQVPFIKRMSYPSTFSSNKFSPAFRVSCALLTWSKKVSYLLSFDSPPGWQWCHQWRPGHIPRSSCICWQTLTGKQKNTDIQPFVQFSLLSIHRPSIHSSIQPTQKPPHTSPESCFIPWWTWASCRWFPPLSKQTGKCLPGSKPSPEPRCSRHKCKEPGRCLLS